ncbi:hypothetical protein BDA99DRAFT_523610 [Phascolomyces articulosus]|uniref:Uncharacterized protein n=1 Tax=Phascolomyces articulosus TaxID=60185 RepID=A0AAD5PAX7_9FUNG|nr:hypothetical protein BDA99DRAFT_523610 [Phascolomyces articulosus]
MLDAGVIATIVVFSVIGGVIIGFYTFIALYICMVELTLPLIFRISYKIRLFDCIYYFTPKEFKNNPEKTFRDYNGQIHKIKDVKKPFLCDPCNSSVCLYQMHRFLSRVFMEPLKSLIGFFSCCGCGLLKQRNLLNSNAEYILPVYQSPGQKQVESLVNEEEEQSMPSSVGNSKDSKENKRDICSPSPVILKSPPRTPPMSTTINNSTDDH